MEAERSAALRVAPSRPALTFVFAASVVAASVVAACQAHGARWVRTARLNVSNEQRKARVPVAAPHGPNERMDWARDVEAA